MRALLPRVANVLAEALSADAPSVRLRAASLLLKAAGFSSAGLAPPDGVAAPADPVGAEMARCFRRLGGS